MRSSVASGRVEPRWADVNLASASGYDTASSNPHLEVPVRRVRGSRKTLPKRERCYRSAGFWLCRFVASCGHQLLGQGVLAALMIAKLDQDLVYLFKHDCLVLWAGNEGTVEQATHRG